MVYIATTGYFVLERVDEGDGAVGESPKVPVREAADGKFRAIIAIEEFISLSRNEPCCRYDVMSTCGKRTLMTMGATPDTVTKIRLLNKQ